MAMYIGPAAVCFNPIKTKRKVQEIGYTCKQNKCFVNKKLNASKFCNNCGSAVETVTTEVEIEDFPRTRVIAASVRLEELAHEVVDAKQNEAYCTFGAWPFTVAGLFLNDLQLHLEEFAREYEDDIAKLRTYFSDVVVANIVAHVEENK